MKLFAPLAVATLLTGCAASAHTGLAPLNSFACHHLDVSQANLKARLHARETACHEFASTCVTDVNEMNRYTRNAEMLAECYPERAL